MIAVAAIVAVGALFILPYDASDACAQEVPDHPDKLVYPKLEYKLPSRESLRHVLKCGIPLWWVENKSVGGLPSLFKLDAIIRAGSLLDPADKPGLGQFAAAMMREGGTAAHERRQLDRQLELRAATIETDITDDSASANLTCLDRDREVCLKYFDEVLRRPAFRDDEIARVRALEADRLKHRNDQPQSIEAREFDRLLFGPHPVSAELTRTVLDSIARADLEAWHTRFVQPQNIIMYGSGDMPAKDIVERLDKLFEGWKAGETRTSFEVAETKQAAAPGIYLMHRQQEQAHVRIGQVAYRREDKDYYALTLLNYVLGGGSFSSRITQSVRVQRGLAYTTFSRFTGPEHHAGLFFAAAQSKSSTAALAAKLMAAEIKRIRDEPVGEAELTAAKDALVESFPRNFETREAAARAFATAEYLGRPADYYDRWRERVNAVSIEDVQRVARTYIDPAKLVIYILGDIAAVRKGGEGEAAVTLESFGLPVKDVPLPEPDNLTTGSK